MHTHVHVCSHTHMHMYMHVHTHTYVHIFKILRGSDRVDRQAVWEVRNRHLGTWKVKAQMSYWDVREYFFNPTVGRKWNDLEIVKASSIYCFKSRHNSARGSRRKWIWQVEGWGQELGLKPWNHILVIHIILICSALFKCPDHLNNPTVFCPLLNTSHNSNTIFA